MSTPHRRVAVITGSAQGIGQAVATRLASDGLDVVISDIPTKRDQLDAVRECILAASPNVKVVVIPADVSVEDDVKNLVAQTVSQLGGLDVMVANAGTAWIKPILESTVEDIDNMFATNYRGVYLCYKEAAKVMIEQKRGGRIIGASSSTGKKGYPMMSIYCGTKAAIRFLTQSAAAEFGSFGITVNAYAPGAVITPLIMSLKEQTDKYAESPSQDSYVQMTAVKRVGEPVDVANLVSFLASEQSSYISAIVTGSAQGIGQGIAARLAADGLDVVISDIPSKQELLDAVSKEIQDAHPNVKVLGIAADVSSDKDVQSLVLKTVSELGGLDVMVANAGICWMRSILDSSVDDIDKMFAVNYRGVFLCYREAAKVMIEQKRGGRIIGNMLPSLCIFNHTHPKLRRIIYIRKKSSTKAAIRFLTQSAAGEFGSHGITVNAYAPGPVVTPLMLEVVSKVDPLTQAATVAPSINRVGQVDDVANLVSFLASEQSSYISGQTLTVDGGSEMKPSKLGEQFEMVRWKIIEDSPEKTVTMWRENVADAGGSNGGGSRSSEVGMSVYYVNPDDYAIEEGGDAMREEVISEQSRLGRGDGQTTASYESHGYERRQDPYYPARATSSTGQPMASRSSQTTGSRTRNGSGSSQSFDNPMTLAARNILASCTPSLLHVSPILVTLGITTEEHLKAMVRLNEDTRDRVVRDEALRKGITVMEWAILLDRLREL
ncbi:hypothetical protein ONZ45_g7526 [Pleurotus djamor]|nr:hypothetical protein ONZ45_g7526 [Pleurotus djamor]